MNTFITIVHISTIILLILVVLLQSGKGAEISASFGGSSQTVFGSSGGANFFTRFTAALATIFMCTSVALTILGSDTRHGVFKGTSATQEIPNQEVPADAVPSAKPKTPPIKAKKK